MNFQVVNRRTHLYLALFLLPWFFVYGVSSIPFAHPKWGESVYDDGKPLWTLRFEKPYDVAVPEGNKPEDLRPLGARIMAENGLTGSFGTYRQSPTQVNVYNYTFLKSTQVKYFTDKKLLRAEDRRFRWDHLLTGMHARGGFEQEGWLEDAWGVVVDVVCVAFLVWIASGLVMWWQVRGHRTWGWIALAAGCAAFVAFLVGL